MMLERINSFFFSKILYKNILTVPDSVFGKINDAVLDFGGSMPVITALEIRVGSRLIFVSADCLEIYHDEREHYLAKLNTDHLKMMPAPENGFFVARNFLDKQIVDVHGRKVERVNDVRVGYVGGKWVLLAVDIGMRGLMRRMGMEYPVIRICRLLRRKPMRNKLVSWESVQPISSGLSSLQLSTSMNKLTTLHAADIADIVEDLDKQSQMTVIHSLDDETAAEVLEEMEEDDQQDLLKTLPDEKASDLLEIMPSDEAADILENVSDSRAEKLLDQMDKENSNDIRELMEYEDCTVGSVMTNDFVAYGPDTAAGDVIAGLKEKCEEEEISHYIYLTDKEGHLTGLVTLLDVASAGRSTKLSELMTDHLYLVHDENRIDKVMDLMQKYNLQAMPVTDENNVLVGIIFLNDLIHEYIKLRRISA
jgi:magnesium transporter